MNQISFICTEMGLLFRRNYHMIGISEIQFELKDQIFDLLEGEYDKTQYPSYCTPKIQKFDL